MIIVKLVGGLGNQMFQYAAGKQLSALHNTELKIDPSFYLNKFPSGVTPREIELDLLNTKLNFATQEEIDYFSKSKNNRYQRWLHRKVPVLFNNIYLSESGSDFSSLFFRSPKNTYLDGYWQTEKYFSKIRSVLVQEFQPKNEFSSDNLNYLSKIKSENSVSVHFRRGDYVSNPNAASYHGVLPLSYYDNAVNLLSTRLKNPEFFVFSDDIPWVIENFKIPFPVHFVQGNQGKSAVFDLALMYSCKHNIIANSSFSWWGGWLNTNPEKIVVAPKNWFSGSYDIPNDLIPAKWVIL
ncbi:MAG: alpha-1,2-fucosyltransferase [Bacteroidota bacterium]|jgi:hypothetical protein